MYVLLLFLNPFDFGRLYLATTRGLGTAYARTWTESGEPQDPIARIRPLEREGNPRNVAHGGNLVQVSVGEKVCNMFFFPEEFSLCFRMLLIETIEQSVLPHTSTR